MPCCSACLQQVGGGHSNFRVDLISYSEAERIYTTASPDWLPTPNSEEPLLSENNDIQYLDAFDKGIWQQLKRGEFLEVQAKIHLPESASLMYNLPRMQWLIKVMQQVGDDPLKDSEAAEAYNAFLELTSTASFDVVPVVFEAVSTSEYTFAAKLKASFLEVAPEEIEGEATVIGKITRLIPPGKKEELFSITPQITSLLRLMNRQQKRKAGTTDPPALIAERIQGPAAMLAVLAVFT